jgi:hypothetical protein
MTTCDDCTELLDPHPVVRDGTDQVERSVTAPDPSRAPVDERRSEHAIAFASAYSSYLRYFDPTTPGDAVGDPVAAGDWSDFFGSDISARLAVAAVDQIEIVRTQLDGWRRELEDPPLPASDAAASAALAAVFDTTASIATAIDRLAAGLPTAHALRATIGNLVRSQLSPMLRRLIGYRLAGESIGVVAGGVAPPPGLAVLGSPVRPMADLIVGPGLAPDWAAGVEVADWESFVAVDPAPHVSAYGPGAGIAERANHLATHHLFRAATDAFLGAHAAVVDGARAALRTSLEWKGHQPHYGLFLAFLDALDRIREQANGLTAKHLDFYYRDVLRLVERPAEPTHAHVLVELAKHVATYPVETGTLLRAGKDDQGDDAHFVVDRDLVANRATVEQISSVYRHRNTVLEQLPFADGRVFASPVTASDDGVGGELTSADGSWHPFAAASYAHGALTEIRMPEAEIGFALASHHLWLSEGARTVTIGLATSRVVGTNVASDLRCRLTTTDGWLDVDAIGAHLPGAVLALTLELSGGDPAITGYDAAVHGYSFTTAMPVLLVTLRHTADRAYAYDQLADVDVSAVSVRVGVDGLKTVTLSNDHGPVDATKPFLAYGSTPRPNSSLVIGSPEAFQKAPAGVTVRATWMEQPQAHATTPTVTVDVLDAGVWESLAVGPYVVGASAYQLPSLPPPSGPVELTSRAPYTTSSRDGFVRLRLSGGFGTDTYPVALAAWIAAGATPSQQPQVPVLPLMASLSLDYVAEQQIDLAEPTEASGRFFHVTPFGHVEQSLAQGGDAVALLPRFRTSGPVGAVDAEAELYLGIADLRPPQQLSLLFQVVDGTANPLVAKPDAHLRWSYLRGDEWVEFAADAVSDVTDGLLDSGIVGLAVPGDASVDHTMLPAGLHWIRVAVAGARDAVCRLVTVATQALRATDLDRANGATSHTTSLPEGTITKLDPAASAVKAVSQPFPTFGGRPTESPGAFNTRVSERLRHKDRAIALWDVEHLVLGEFPEVHLARCLPHTQYEPSSSGAGVYRELAPGHVTVVTIPDLVVPSHRDPLRPTTSLRVLGEIERFLAERMSCFATLHVRNPRFEEVRVAMRVRFREGVDETFHLNLLKQEVTRWLSPWAYRSDVRPSFNGRIAKSVLVDFVEERPYVDYVTDVRLGHIDPDTGVERSDLDEVTGARAVSVLVSVPEHAHDITVLGGDEAVAAERCACAPGGAS